MNPLAPCESKPSSHDTMLIDHKCYLTAVLLYNKGTDGVVATLTGRLYIGNTSVEKIDDQMNIQMFEAGIPTKLRDFER